MTQIPASIKTRFLKETESYQAPALRREGNTVWYPAFVREDEREGETLYRYFEVPIPYKGQDLDDIEAFRYQAAADIRKFFYGSPEAQAEMRDDCTWEAHRLAVRSAFPKADGEVNEAAQRFEAIKAAFWAAVDAAAARVGKVRADIEAAYPEGVTGEEMIAWATANGMTQEDIAALTPTFMLVNLNLLSNNRNWSELF